MNDHMANDGRHAGANGAEAELVSRVKAGDEAAFREMVRLHGGALLAAATRLTRDRALAEDCVQEAFLNAHRAFADYEPRGMLRAWLKRLAINAALSKLRRSWAKEDPVDPLLPEFNASGCRIEAPWREPEESVEEAMTRAETQAQVRAKIDELPETHRVIVMLRDIEGLDTREAAEALGITETAAKVRLHRARAALKKLLDPVWREARI